MQWGDWGKERDSTSLWERAKCHPFCRLPQLHMIPSVLGIKPKPFSLLPMPSLICSQIAFPLRTPHKSCVVVIPESHYFQSTFSLLSFCLCCSLCQEAFSITHPLPDPASCLIILQGPAPMLPFSRSLFCLISIHPLLQISESLLTSLWHHILPVVWELKLCSWLVE